VEGGGGGDVRRGACLVRLDLDAQQVSRRDVSGDSDLVPFPNIPDRTCAEGRGRRRKRGVILGLYWRGWRQSEEAHLKLFSFIWVPGTLGMGDTAALVLT
jgi:hypothetical protein